MNNLNERNTLYKLKSLVEDNKKFKITYRSKTSKHFMNHSIHVLCSLYYCGASPEQLQNYYNQDISNLEDLPEPNIHITRENWRDHMRKSKNYRDYLDFFKHEINQLGYLNTFQVYFPMLIPILAGAVMHPFIHIGYGIEFNLPQLLAEGLAYACCYSFSIESIISDLAPAAGILNISYMLEKLSELFLPKLGQEYNIMNRVRRVFNEHGSQISLLISKWDLRPNSEDLNEKLNELTTWSIKLFGDSSYKNHFDFILSHQIGANQAVRAVFPLLSVEDKIKLLRLNLATLLILFLTQGSPKLNNASILDYKPSKLLNITTWNDLLNEILTETDEHLIPLIRTLYKVDKETNFENITYNFNLALKSFESFKLGGGWSYRGIGYYQRKSSL